MRKFIYLAFFMSYSIDYFAQCNAFAQSVLNHPIPPCNNSSYILKFEDNFSGTSLNTATSWKLQDWGQGSLQDCGKGIPEDQQLHTLNNIAVSNGTLKIIAKNQPTQGLAVNWEPPGKIMCDGLTNLRTYAYTSSCIWTKLKYKPYGKYEIRCRMPNGSGLWPSFWTYSGTSDAGGEKWNEIDIIDNTAGNIDFTGGTMWDSNNNGVVDDGDQCRFSNWVGNVAKPDFSQWHTFTCIYEIDKISWWMDINTNPVHLKTMNRFHNLIGGSVINCGETPNGSSYLQQRSFTIDDMHIILELKTRTSGANTVNSNTPFPSYFEVDYVKYWEGVQPAPVLCGADYTVTSGAYAGVATGDNMVMRDNAYVAANTNLKVVATTSITLLPNVYIKPSSIFIAKIDPSVCSLLRVANDSTENNFVVDRTPTDSTLNNNVAEQNLVKDNLNINVYPNPNNGQFNVEINNLEGEVMIELVDLFGKTIYNEISIKSSYTFDLSRYPKGMYLLKTTINSVLSVQKIIYQ